jgi:hypothetical protein
MVPASQRDKLDAQLTSIRNLEARITTTPPAAGTIVPPTLVSEPTGAYEGRVNQVLANQLAIIRCAFQSDLTRVATFTCGHDNNADQVAQYFHPAEFSFRGDGHGCSHNGKTPDALLAKGDVSALFLTFLTQFCAHVRAPSGSRRGRDPSALKVPCGPAGDRRMGRQSIIAEAQLARNERPIAWRPSGGEPCEFALRQRCCSLSRPSLRPVARNRCASTATQSDKAALVGTDVPPPDVASADVAPATTSVTPAGTVVYNPNVYLLDATTTNLAQVQTDRLVFPTTGARGIAKRKAGDILVASKDGNAQFLRRVVSVQKVGTTFVVLTTDAVLTDAIRQATITTSVPAAAASDGGALGPASPLAPADLTGGLFGGKIDFAAALGYTCLGGFECQESVGMRLTPRILGGHFNSNVRADLAINISPGSVDLLRLILYYDADAALKVGLEIEGKGSYRVEATLFETLPIPVVIGDVPTWLQGKIVGGVEGEFYAPVVDLWGEGSVTASLSAGFEIRNGGSPTVFFQLNSLNPSLSAGFNGAGAEVKARRYYGGQVKWFIGEPRVLEAGPSVTVRQYWQSRFVAESWNGIYLESDTGHDVTITGSVKEFGLTQALSLKLADWTDSSDRIQFTGPFTVYPCYDAQDGDYCGGETINGFRNGTPGHLYHCAMASTTSDVTCQFGCSLATGVDQQLGKRVACNPDPMNPCHSAADGNYCGNENFNGFNGGQLGYSSSAQYTCAGGNVSRQLTCSAGCGPISGGSRVGCLPSYTGPNAPCGAGDLAGPYNGTCGPDGRVYYCYQGSWYVKDDCVAKAEQCFVEPPGVADICVTSGGPAQQPPSAPCGAGDLNGPNNGWCGPDGRVYYCYQYHWYLKDDCLAKSQTCVVQPSGVADTCQSLSRLLTPPTAPCGAGDLAGPNNGMCGPDGRVYYCYQGVWNLKDDCVARNVACVVEAVGVADHCTSGCGSSSDCSTGETCTSGRCICPGPVCGTSCCSADAWCGSGSRCCTGCAPGCPC